MMYMPKWEEIRPEGELAYRILKNFARLEDREYRPESIFSMDKSGWPGDWEGRTILALVLLSRVTGRKAAWLDAILVRLKEEYNERGYLKEILPDGIVNEQQLSGHNWLLRGLLEYYLWTGEEEAAHQAKRIVENLYLKAAGKYADYPLDQNLRSLTGGAAGHVEGEAVCGWKLSTDIGCAYMSMDGLSQYFEIFRDPRVEELLGEMAENFGKIDFMGASMQTHASLSAVRGLMRYYRCTGKLELLEQAAAFFDFYREHGMTENYANFNWFGRPYWTEPCAIVDSYLLAMDLFRETKRFDYAETAARIYYNALGFAQRQNGGFGCDECAGPNPDEILLRAQNTNYEAFWCCSMRGAEGLSAAARTVVLAEDDRGTEAARVWLTGYFEGDYRIGGVKLHIRSGFPQVGNVTVVMEENTGTRELLFYIPENADRGSVQVQGKNGKKEGIWKDGFYSVTVTGREELSLRFDQPQVKRGTVSRETPEGYYTLWRGVLLLGRESGNDSGETGLRPINKGIYRDRKEMTETGIRILFAEEASGQE